mgnify:CR=1 FL=1
MTTKIYTNDNIPHNQRVWRLNRYSPSKCKYCGKPILFLKNIHWNYVACDAKKVIVTATEGDRKILDEEGMIVTSGRRFGWPVHECAGAVLPASQRPEAAA